MVANPPLTSLHFGSIDVCLMDGNVVPSSDFVVSPIVWQSYCMVRWYFGFHCFLALVLVYSTYIGNTKCTSKSGINALQEKDADMQISRKWGNMCRSKAESLCMRMLGEAVALELRCGEWIGKWERRGQHSVCKVLCSGSGYTRAHKVICRRWGEMVVRQGHRTEALMRVSKRSSLSWGTVGSWIRMGRSGSRVRLEAREQVRGQHSDLLNKAWHEREQSRSP